MGFFSSMFSGNKIEAEIEAELIDIIRIYKLSNDTLTILLTDVTQ